MMERLNPINEMKASICGLWVDDDCNIHLLKRNQKQESEYSVQPFSPYVWTTKSDEKAKTTIELGGSGPLGYRLVFSQREAYEAFLKINDNQAGVYAISLLENQYLLSHRERLFEHMAFSDMRRMQLDIETASSQGGFSNPKKKDDRILAIGLSFSQRMPERILEIGDMTDQAERQLLLEFTECLQGYDPDVIEGHNIFNFDWMYLKTRAEYLGVECKWGRFGKVAEFRNSRIRIAERWLSFLRCDLPGRTVFDTYLMVQFYDLSTREMTGYGLKEVAIQLGISQEEKRTYLPGNRIQEAFFKDRENFRKYLLDDLRETAGVADILMPTYFAQCKDFPMNFQEIVLRGNAQKVESILIEKYYHANYSLPFPSEIEAFGGGYTESFKEGVFKNVLHFDIASLYPSLMLMINKNPQKDTLGVFIPLLKELREYRLRYKALAKDTTDENLRKEYNARQTSFKILINSFYGYLGFGGARFADSGLAGEITARGREILGQLITLFRKQGCNLLEVDTDGIYLSTDIYFEKPMALLDKVSKELPVGIDLEYDGSYVSMFCYKAKNYALYDGKKIIVRGSALRSRGIEGYLKAMNSCLIHYLLGIGQKTPKEQADIFRKAIINQALDINLLAKKEYLSQNPVTYKREVEASKKSRRASLEVALQQVPIPRMGEKVTYYITYGTKPNQPDWQRAVPIEKYNAQTIPYDAQYYCKKLDEWMERYDSFLEKESNQWVQGTLDLG